MKILFIYPQPRIIKGRRMFNIGIAYLSAILKKGGHETALLNIDKFDKSKIDSKISSFNPGLICYSSTTDQIDIVKKCAYYIEKKFKLLQVIGGVHPTVFPEDSISIKGIDGICVGEGEEAMLELANALSSKKDYLNIKNFWFKTEEGIVKNGVRPLLENLDSLPYPDRDLFDYKDLLKNHPDGIEFMAGRGCPYQCTYCINPKLQKVYAGKGRFVRYRSVNNFLKEISEVVKKYNYKGKITFHDDTFTLNKEWIKEFCEKYSKKIGIGFRCNVRADSADEEMLKMLAKAGCYEIWVGVESGNEELRNKVLKKRITNKQISDIFSWAKKYGIKTMAFNMIGIPYETEEQIKETFEFNKKINPDIKALNVFRPYPGTELHDICFRNKWISDRKVSGYGEDSILDQPSISAEKVRYYREIFYPYMMNSRWLWLIKILVKIKIGKKSVYGWLKWFKKRV